MFTVYARPGSGSAAVEALLAELGADFRVEDMVRLADGSIPPALFELNPRGEVPVLRLLDDTLMTESAAMMIYLADLFPSAGMAPAANSTQRPDYLRWIMYFSSAVYMADLRYFYPARYSTDAGHAAAIKIRASEHMDRDFKIFAEALGPKQFVLGNQFSAADIYIAMLTSWVPDLTVLFARHPNLKSHYDAVAARPKIAPVWQRNKMP